MFEILQNNIETFKVMVEESPMPVGVYTGSDLVISYVNKAMLKVWGKDISVIGEKLTEVLPELKGQPMGELLHYVYSTGFSYKATEDRVDIMVNGKLRTFFFNFTYKPLFDKQHNILGILHTATDVTQLVLGRKKELEINKALASSNKNFTNLVQQAPVAIGILRGEDLIVDMVNEELLKLWGKDNRILNKPILKALPELEGTEIPELLNKVYKTGQAIYGFEKLVYLERNGKMEECYFNFIYNPLTEEDNTVSAVMVTGSEVTQQVKSKIKLKNSEKRFRSLILEAPMATALYTGRDMVIELANEAMLKVWAKDKSVIGKKLEDALPELKNQPFLDILDKVYTTGKPYHTEGQEATFIIDGQPQSFWFNFTYKPLFDDQGNIYGIINMAVDISTQVQLQQQKDEFLGIASHELKTPVTVLKAYVQVLEEMLLNSRDEVKANMIHKMDSQINRLNHLIGDLLDVTKINSGRIELNYTTYDFNALITEVVEEIQSTAGKHIIEIKAEEMGNVYGDKDRTGQVLVNLLTNAVKYSPNADRVIVTVKKDGENAQVSVRDFGIGISEEHQQKIFDQFYRVKDKNGFAGLGLGLYISADFIRRVGGKLWVESEEGKGSTFYFTIPIQKG